MAELVPGSVEQAETSQTPNEHWIKEVDAAAKELRKFWERGRRVVKRYMDDSEPASQGFQQVMNVDKYNVFWANVGVLKSALYANPPKPVVKREFDDYQDQIGRVASQIMERLLSQPFEHIEAEANDVFTQVVEDRLIPGLGQVWLRYEPEIEDLELEPAVTDKKKRVIKPAVTSSQIVNEEVEMDYVYWEDFLWSPSRTWKEVRWVARRVYMDRKEFTKRFGAAKAGLVSWTSRPSKEKSDRVTPENLAVKKTEVFEIWDKPTRTVVFLSRSCSYLLETTGDPLEIHGFFPCPPPLRATTTTSSTVPKADYLMVQSQYRRLDNLTLRIGMLEDAIQASGVYDKSNKELSQLLSGNMNKMIPVDNWAMFAEKGGIKGVVDWFPLDMIVGALDKLRELKGDAKTELYELTGISDIMRGTSAPRETATAQGLKAQYSSVRLQFVQGEVAKFVQATLRIKADIICKHFQPENIIKNSMIDLTPDAEMAPAAVALLKDTWERHYRVVIYADTLSIPDYNAERQGRTEFITAMGQYISQVIPLVQMEPGATPFLMQILQWGVASFRSAQSIEGVFNKALTEMTKALMQPKPPAPPDPKLIAANAKIQGDAAKAQQTAAHDQQKFQQAMVLEQQKATNSQQIEVIQAQADIAADQGKQQAATTKMIADAVAAALTHQADLVKADEKHRQAMVHTQEKHAVALRNTPKKEKVK
jgi:hypothetical protein